jgi:hypothetical protein
MEVFMELNALKKWYEKHCKDAEWFKNADLQWALDRKEKLRADYEGAVRDADSMLQVYTDILDRRDLILEVIKARDPEFEGILDEKEGK